MITVPFEYNGTRYDESHIDLTMRETSSPSGYWEIVLRIDGDEVDLNDGDTFGSIAWNHLFRVTRLAGYWDGTTCRAFRVTARDRSHNLAKGLTTALHASHKAPVAVSRYTATGAGWWRRGRDSRPIALHKDLEGM